MNGRPTMLGEADPRVLDNWKLGMNDRREMTTLLGRWGPELLVLLVALTLRVEGLHRISLCHYDEGVYVSSAIRLAGGAPEGFAFGQAQHAPPLYPLLVGILYQIIGIPWPNLALYVNALFGTMTVVLVYGLARQMWSRSIAVIAALLLAASDYHIALSRMALTDVSFTFWFSASLVAFLCANRSWQQGQRWSRWSWSVVAGLCSGAAWNTKYHGWLAPVFILLFAVATAVRSLVQKGKEQSPVKGQPSSTECRSDVANLPLRLVLASIILTIATLTFLPWFFYIQQHLPGGYRSVLQIHKSYLSSVIQWPAHAAVLLQSLPAFRHYGWLLVVNLGIISFAISSAKWPRRMVLLLLAALAAFLGADVILLALAAVSAVRLLWAQGAGPVMAAVWLLTWCALTPFYTPFLRLLLPAWPAVAVLAAPRLWQLIAGDNSPLVHGHSPVRCHGRSSFTGSLSLAELATVLGFLGWLCLTQPFGFLPGRGLWQRWDSHRGYREFAQWVDENTSPDAAFLCQGQPPFSIYCPRQAVVLGNEPFSVATRGLAPQRPAYLAVDFRAIHEEQSTARDDIAQNVAALELIHVIPLDCNLVVLLDYLPPREVAEKIAHNEIGLHKLQSNENEQLSIPAPIESRSLDAIIVYRIRLDKLADRP